MSMKIEYDDMGDHFTLTLDSNDGDLPKQIHIDRGEIGPLAGFLRAAEESADESARSFTMLFQFNDRDEDEEDEDDES